MSSDQVTIVEECVAWLRCSLMSCRARYQVLYSLETSSGDSSEEAGGGKKPIPTAHKIKTELEGGAHKSFTEIFGQRKRPNGTHWACLVNLYSCP